MSTATNKMGTAIVTGASAGIGKVFAEQLASKGYDLYLVARRGDRLIALAQELRQKHGISVKTQAADLSAPAELESVAEAVAEDEAITLLVNNAGTSFVGPLDTATVDQLTTLVSINVVALTRLSMAVLPGFKARNRGVVINIGSVLGFNGYPYAAIYSGTKAYVQNLSRALQAELANTDVRVQLVTPASTVSEIWEVQGFPLSNLDPTTVMSTEDCVKAALLGLERNEAVTAPSIEDGAAVQAYFDEGAALFNSSQSGRLASRYTTN